MMQTTVWNSTASRVLAEHHHAGKRSGTTMAAASLAYVVMAFNFLGAGLTWWLSSYLEDITRTEPTYAKFAAYDVAFDMLRLVAIILAVVGILYAVFGYLVSQQKMAGWIGLLVLSGLSLISTVATGTSLTNLGFWLNLSIVVLLLTPLSRNDCGVRRSDHLQREILRMQQDQMVTALSSQIRAAKTVEELELQGPPPDRPSPHPRGLGPDDASVASFRYEPAPVRPPRSRHRNVDALRVAIAQRSSVPPAAASEASSA